MSPTVTSTDPLTGTTTTVPGYTPNYGQLIANDPTLKQIQADLAASGVADLGSRNAAINRYLVGFGAVPDVNAASKSLGIDLGQAVDPTTAALAQENPYSTEANLSKSHTDALRQIRQGLAARGGLRSGELGFQLGKENTAYGQAQSDATQKVLDLIAGVQAAYTDAQRQAQAQLNDAAMTTAGRVADLYPATGSQVATYDAGASAAAGAHVYKGPDGRYYNQDGSAYNGPTSAPQTQAQQSYGVDPTTGLPAGADSAPHTSQLNRAWFLR